MTDGDHDAMNLFQQLDEEWARITRSPTAGKRLAEWTESSPVLAGFGDLDAVVQIANRRGKAHESDLILVALAQRAGTDDLAARTLLQAVMPGMRWLARRYHHVASAAGEDPNSLVIALTYERIRTYPFDRRPGRIAANVLFDTRQRLQRTVGRPGPKMVALESLPFEPAGDDGPHNEQCALLDQAVAQRVIVARDADLIALTRLHDYPIAELAAHLGCPAQTLRQRRRRAEALLVAVI
jgi:DNA-directed RNA polymerase specialized sigma24 family protein